MYFVKVDGSPYYRTKNGGCVTMCAAPSTFASPIFLLVPVYWPEPPLYGGLDVEVVSSSEFFRFEIYEEPCDFKYVACSSGKRENGRLRSPSYAFYVPDLSHKFIATMLDAVEKVIWAFNRYCDDIIND